MKLAFDPAKEQQNIRKHGLGFSLADVILADPLALTTHDRFENGEDRWRTVAAVGFLGKVLVMVHTDPAPDDDRPIRIIGLREATSHERRLYENADHPA